MPGGFMKLKNVAGITCYVKDLNKTDEFYKILGFLFSKRDPDHIKCLDSH